MQGTHPDDGQPLEFVDGSPDGGKVPELTGISEAFAPEYKAEEIFEKAQQLYKKSKSWQRGGELGPTRFPT